MTAMNSAELCPADLLAETVAELDGAGEQGVAKVDRLLLLYPRDARLHFLRGSLLAGLAAYPQAREAMAVATTLAPDYALARFQLGFLELTSGDAAKALQTWAPLRDLEPEQPLRLFVEGLTHLVADEFRAAIASLNDGIARNPDLPPLNADMRLIIARVETLMADGLKSSGDVSASHLLLQQYGDRTKH